MAVQFDASAFASNGTISAGTVTSAAAFINVGSGPNGTSNRALVVAISFANVAAGVVSAVSMTWNGVAMTAISNFANASDTYVFGIVAPNTGANTLAASWTGNAGTSVLLAGLSVVGADQTGGATTFHNFGTNTSSGSPASVTVTSATGEIAAAFHDIGSSFTTASGTDIGHNNVQNIAAFASNWDNGAATVALTYTCGAGTWKSGGLSIKAVAGASAVYGWWPTGGSDIFNPRNVFAARMAPDERLTFFRPSQVVVPTSRRVPTAGGGDFEHIFPVVRRPDEPPGPWFVRSPNPVPTTRRVPTAGGGDVERIFPIVRRPDEPPGPWFVRSPNPVPTTRRVPSAGEDLERLPPVKENPDPAKQWFVQSPNPVPTSFWTPPLSDREKLPPIKENPDPAKQWFVRSPNLVPTAFWMPPWSDREKLPPTKENPDPAKQWFVRSAHPVPTVYWMPPLADREKLPPVKENPDPSKQWFAGPQSQAATVWLPTAGETEHVFPITRSRDEPPGPWFVRSPNPVPTVYWTPPLADREKLPPVKENPDPAKQWFVRSPKPVPITWLPTAGDADHPIAPIVQYHVTWRVQPSGAASTIAGMAWSTPKEEMRPASPLNPDIPRQWFITSPPFIFGWHVSAEEPRQRPLPQDDAHPWVFGPLRTVPAIWLPMAGEDIERLPPVPRAPDEPPGPFFAQSPNPVPVSWLPTTGADIEKPPPIAVISDQYRLTLSPHKPFIVVIIKKIITTLAAKLSGVSTVEAKTGPTTTVNSGTTAKTDVEAP